MDRYEETFETWNNIASLYQEKFMDLDLYDHTYDFVCKSIRKHQAKLLEIGCGPGNITKYLLSVRPDFDILGIDIAPNMVLLAEENNTTARFAIMDSRQIDIITAIFDGIICGFCLPYLAHTDGKKFIKDCSNLLNEGGLLYLSFVEGKPRESGFKVGSGGGRCYFYYYDLNDLMELLKENKFGDFTISKVVYKRSEIDHEEHTIITAWKTEL